MTTRKMARLCQSVLPPGFDQVKTLAPALQSFLEQNLPDSVNQSVTVLTLNQDEIVVAANSPMVANFLRLHATEIQQQLRETFKLEQALKFRTIPDSLLKVEHEELLRQPRQVSDVSIESLRRNAQWIEDEELKAAILSLAESLESD